MRQGKKRKQTWAGIAILVIAGVHTTFGLLGGLRILPDPEMQRLVGERVPLLELQPAALGAAPTLASLTMLWFLFFGVALVPLGALVRHLEKRDVPVPHFVGYQLIALSLSGALFLPASGFWFALIPAWQVFRQNR